MYLVLVRKPYTRIHFADGALPPSFSLDSDTYTLLDEPRVTATWRVDSAGYPVAVFCRLVPGEKWPPEIEALPRMIREGTTLAFWLTNDRNFERRDILIDEVAIYRAGYANYAFVFSLDGISAPTHMHRLHWP